MHIGRIRAQGFRCFGEGNVLDLKLRPGLNILVGENDSGKSAIVDAIRLALGSRSEEWLRVTDEDFHIPPDGDTSVRGLEIICSFFDLTEEEQARFLEWCTLVGGEFQLHVCLRGSLQATPSGGLRCTWTRRSGEAGDGPSVDGALREYLAATYLRPLRDAERDLSPRRHSRLSKILASLPEMVGQDDESEGGDPTVRSILKQADDDIEALEPIKTIKDRVNAQYLSELSIGEEDLLATLGIGRPQGLAQVLERLQLALHAPRGQDAQIRRGLGLNNILFMAAELLLLQHDTHNQLPVLLIEEPEAHLHPQLQSRFMKMLEEQTGAEKPPLQVLLTTHSPTLAASADVQTMTLVADTGTYPLAAGHTKLDEADYSFLRRFLDATKANLFFARAVLVVEGDAENLLLPAIARKLGRPLDRYGVSIVNVGHTGLFRYSRILQRSNDEEELPIRVALVGDRDTPPAEALARLRPAKDAADEEEPEVATEEPSSEPDEDEGESTAVDRFAEHSGGGVKGFLSPYWTLEYDLAADGFPFEMLLAIKRARNARRTARRRTDDKVREITQGDIDGWVEDELGTHELAAEVYQDLYKKRVSKAEAAEQLAAIMLDLEIASEDFRQRLPDYLVEALDYVTFRSLEDDGPQEDTDADGGG